jgi:pyranose oxidase
MAGNGVSADVLIVGSGPIGATYARVLVEAGMEVLLVDAGAQLSPTPGAHLRNDRVYQYNKNNFESMVAASIHTLSIPSQSGYQETLDKTAFWAKSDRVFNFHNPKQDPTRNLSNAAGTYAVGGMFTHWTAATPRQHPTLERTPLIPAEEWDDLYTVAEAYFNTHTDQFDFDRNRVVKKALTDHFAQVPSGYPYPVPADYPVQNLPVAAERRTGFGGDREYMHWTGVDGVLGPLLTDPELASRFTILPQHLVTRLESEGGRVVRAHVQDFTTLTERTIEADHFVVASGAMFGPQLLWASGIRHEALGRYLNDQIVASCLVVLSKDIVASIGPPPSPADPIPMPLDAPEPEVWIPVSGARPWHCQIHYDPINFTTPGGELVDERLLVFVQWFGMVEAEERNRVFFLDDIPDLMGMPQPTFEYEVSDAAAARAHTMIDDMSSASLAIGGWLPGQLPEFEPPGASLHFMSTTRMGEADDGASVVDPQSRHWGFENLYVGGCGVIPEMSACNPTLTAAAIAVRSAHAIAGTRPAASLGGISR